MCRIFVLKQERKKERKINFQSILVGRYACQAKYVNYYPGLMRTRDEAFSEYCNTFPCYFDAIMIYNMIYDISVFLEPIRPLNVLIIYIKLRRK